MGLPASGRDRSFVYTNSLLEGIEAGTARFYSAEENAKRYEGTRWLALLNMIVRRIDLGRSQSRRNAAEHFVVGW